MSPMNTSRKLTDWAKGPPPSIGWWNASRMRNERARRWWNGASWSVAVMVNDPEAKAKRAQRTPDPWAGGQSSIEWRGLAENPAGVRA